MNNQWRRLILNRFSSFCLMLLLLSCSHDHSDPAYKDILAGNEHFRQERPGLALESYRQALRAGHRSSGLFYNFANAAYLEGHRDQALVALELALDLSPRDPDILQNRLLILAQEQQRESERFGTWHDKFPGAHLISEREFFIFSCACLSLVLLLIVLSKFIRPLQQSRFQAFFLVIKIVGFGAFLYGLMGFITIRAATLSGSRAFVVAEAIPLRSDASEQGLKLFEIRRDTPLRVLESVPSVKIADPIEGLLDVDSQDIENQWYRVRAPDGVTGWLPAHAVIVY